MTTFGIILFIIAYGIVAFYIGYVMGEKHARQDCQTLYNVWTKIDANLREKKAQEFLNTFEDFLEDCDENNSDEN